MFSATRIDAVMPSNAPLGRVSVQVTYGAPSPPCFGPGSPPYFGPTGNPAPVTVTTDSFGIFSLNGLGYGPGAIQNVLADNSQQANSATQPAPPGQIVVLTGSGLGAVDGPDTDSPAAMLPTPVAVFVGGRFAAVSSSGRVLPGKDQIVFTVPDDQNPELLGNC